MRARIRFFAYNLGMISKELQEFLVCPACLKPLVMQEDGKGLKCGECHRVYAIRDDVPNFLVDEATIEP